MANNANIKAVISADDNASKVLNNFGNNAAKVGKTLAVGFAAAGAAIAAVGVSSVKAYQESQDAVMQTNAVLVSTGNAAGVTRAQVTELANSLQKVTKFGDETIRTGQNLLLTFTKIGKDVFPEATEVMLDMSQALGQDIKSSAVQLGKALQDPILGVTALRRVGVNFSKDQQDVIKKLVETGKAAEAQRLILKELQTEFGGSARAAGQTFAGKLEILKNQIGEVQEAIGFVIVDAIQPFVAAIADFVNAVDWEKVIDRSIFAIKKLWQDYIVPFAKSVREVADAIASYLQPKLKALWNTIKDSLPTFKEFAQDILLPMAKVLGVALVVAIGLAVDALNVLLTVVKPVISWLSDNEAVVWGLVGAYVALKTALLITGAITAVTGAISVLGSSMGAATISTLGLKTTLMSLALPAGAFAVVATAAITAAVLITQKWAQTTDTINATKNAIASAGASAVIVTAQLEKLIRTGTSAQATRAYNTLHGLGQGAEANRALGISGFATGGFTGTGNQNEVAGVVHKGEYVLPKNMVDQSTGTPKMGGTTINLSVNVGMYAGTEIEKRKMAQALLDAMRDLAGSNNMSVGQLLG